MAAMMRHEAEQQSLGPSGGIWQTRMPTNSVLSGQELKVCEPVIFEEPFMNPSISGLSSLRWGCQWVCLYVHAHLGLHYTP